MNKVFSGRRLGNLFRKDLVEDYRSLLIAVGAVTGVLLLNYVIGALSDGGGSPVGVGVRNSVMQLTYFSLTLFIGGFIISSRAFVELHTRNRDHDWLMVPASRVEKYLTRLLLTTVGVGVGTVIYFSLFSLVAAGITRLLVGRANSLFSPFDGRVWLLVLHYCVLQSIFFAGAVYFKKAQFIKTVLVVTAFLFVLVLVAVGVMRIVYWREFPFLVSGDVFTNLDLSSIGPRLQAAGRIASVIASVLYWAFLAPALWIFAYYRLSEVEVRNGV